MERGGNRPREREREREGVCVCEYIIEVPVLAGLSILFAM